MAIYYFTNQGEPCTPFEETGEDLMKKGMAIKATVPDGIEAWRLSYDTVAKKVVVRYEDLSNEDAVAKQLADSLAQSEAETTAEKERQAAFEE